MGRKKTSGGVKEDELLQDIQVAHLLPLRTVATEEQGPGEEILKSIDEMVLENQEDLEFAAEILTEIKGKKKILEEQRGEATGPLYKVIRVIERWFRPAVGYYEKAEIRLKNRIADYHNRKRAELEAALEVAGEASMAGDGVTSSEALQIAREAQVHKVPGVWTSDIIKYEVVDIALVPREFLKVDPEAVEAYLAEHGVDAKIPGIKIWKDVSVSARAAKGV